MRLEFEWDENKREANLRKHGLDLTDGAALFDRRPVITYPSPRGDEARFVTVGLREGIFVSAVWTERASAIRLISLRRARGMARSTRTVRASAEELRRRRAAGESKTDWTRVNAMSQQEVERLADAEEGPLPEGWESAVELGVPERKQGVHIRLGAKVLR